ncbi:MAG TPA: ABC transporter substrate-binding protein, partial [Candidatus Nesterenkonia stercoripullorum]|nr:ABC transporter substrate-binding protein [Candidatus Nesterenkonia stercoripullorum]
MTRMNRATRRRPRGRAHRPGPAWSAVAGGSCLLLLLAGCSDTGPSAAQPSAQGGSQDSITVENCGEELHFDVPPERVLLLETAPLTILDQLGLTDRIVARAGDFNPDYYSSDLNQKVSGIESLTDDLDASGHLAISQEEVVAHDPDLVLGQPDGVTREGLNAAGSQLLVQEVYCNDQDGDQHVGNGTDERPGSDAASFDTLYREIEAYGEIFQ